MSYGNGFCVNYTYDALGRLISMTEQAGSSGVQRMRAGYDTSNRLVSTEYALSPALDGVFGEAKAYGYTYNEADGSLSSMTLPENGSLAYTYDGLKRLTARQLKQGENEVVKRSYRYLPGAGENETTLMVSKLTNTRGVDVYSDFSYEYDVAGNILSISSVRKRKEKAPGGTRVISSQCETSYVYDQQGQLVKEYSYSKDPDNNDRDAYGLRYSYDAAGNLLSWGNGEAPFALGYGDEAWPDLLTSFRGKPISYDAIGNPTKWHNGTDFTWINGRRLAGAVNSATGLDASYAYNVDGLRMAKTVNGVEHKYIWQGGRLVSEAYGGRELEFFYDEGGNPCALRYRSGAGAEPVVYYYVTNLQGDVLSLVDGEGFSAAEYYYNAWGLPMGFTGAMAEINPLRYRGYYYDTELGMYYLKSRYYDPFVCRFINADEILSTGQGFIGTNMFAYCNNNPVAMVDSQGELANWLIGGLVGGLVGGIVSSIKGDGFSVGFAQGAAAGAIAGAAVDVALAVVATGPVGLIAAPLIAWCGGFAGSIVGDEVYSLATGNGLRRPDSEMLETAGNSGFLNVAAFGVSGLLKYADEGVKGFNTSKAIPNVLKAAYGESFVPKDIDVYSAFTAANFAIYGYFNSAFAKKPARKSKFTKRMKLA